MSNELEDDIENVSEGVEQLIRQILTMDNHYELMAAFILLAQIAEDAGKLCVVKSALKEIKPYISVVKMIEELKIEDK